MSDRPSLSNAEAAALAAWCERARSSEPLGDVAQGLLALPVVVRAAAALAALQASLAVDDPDPQWQTPQRVARLLADHLEHPEADLAELESATGAVESSWNAVAGDSGHPEPTYQAATYAGWTVTHPDQPWNVVHALTGAAEAAGERRVLDAIREALLPYLTSPSHRHGDTTALLELAAGELHLAVSPEIGGAIARFSRRWQEGGRAREVHWLRPATPEALAQGNPLGMASFPLVPFCNRIRDGRAAFGGREIRFPPNHPAEDSPHPLHGIGWQRAWTVEAQAPGRLALALQVDASPAWPWRFSARQIYTLQPDRLLVRIALTNEDDATMPAGIGHHPYFPHEPGTRLRAETQAMWETDAEVLPTRLSADAEPVRPLRGGVELARLHTDNNFTGWSREARIDWPADAQGPARSALLQAEAPLDYFVLYCQRGFAYFCAEPVSQCTDWLNLGGAHPQPVLGGHELAPGATIEATFTLMPRWD